MKKLTLVNFREVFGRNKLFKLNKSWCPKCLDEMKVNSVSVYEKLIWNLEQYKVCVKHLTYLEDTCPYCGKKQNLLPRNGRNGYCQECNSWLGNDKIKNKINNKQDEMDKFNAMKIEECFNYFFNVELILKEDLISSFKYIREKVNNHTTQYDFVKKINITNSSFLRYCNGEVSPTLETLLEISNQLNISLIDILENNCNKMTLKKLDGYFPRFLKGDNRRNLDQIKAKSYLEEVLKSQEKVTLEEIYLKLNTSPRALHNKFPELMDAIKSKNSKMENQKPIKRYYHKRDSEDAKKYLRKVIDSPRISYTKDIAHELGIGTATLIRRFPDMIKENQLKNKNIIARQKESQKIEKYLSNYINENSYRSILRITNDLGFEERVIKQAHKNLWDRVVKKNIEIENAYTHIGGTNNSLEVERIRLQILEYLNQSADRPIYITDIKKDVCVSRFKICKYLPEIHEHINMRNKEIIQENKLRVDQKRREQIKKAIIQLISQGIYPSVRRVKKETGYEFGYKKELNDFWRMTVVELWGERK